MPAHYIVRLQAADLDQLRQLLSSVNLPSDDCDPDSHYYVGLFDRGQLIAAGGLEPAGDDVLFRSLVVADDYRGAGLAAEISRALIATAEQRGYRAVYLLTETAADYLRRLGFGAIDRQTVPNAVAATRQFDELCPDSACCMQLELNRD